jgi:hypothetical protein
MMENGVVEKDMIFEYFFYLIISQNIADISSIILNTY